MKLYRVQNNKPFPVSISIENGNLVVGVGDTTIAIDEATGQQVQSVTFRSREINLENLRQRNDFGDHAYFCFYGEGLFGDRIGGDDDVVMERSVFNLFALTKDSKVDAGTYKSMVLQKYPLGVIYVPFADSPVSEWSLGVRMNPDSELTAGSGIEVVDGITLPTTGAAVIFPEVKFDQSAITSSGQIAIQFHLESATGGPVTNKDADVYFETTSGRLISNRVRTVGGQGAVVLDTTGLPAGQVCKVKCGFKFFTGTDDCFVTVA